MTRRRRGRRSPAVSSGHLRLLIPSSSPWGFLFLVCFISVLGLCFSAAAVGDCSDTHGEDGCRPCFDFRDACADRSSFCFASAAPGFLASEDGTKKPDSEASSAWVLSRPLRFGMPSGGVVTCSSVDSVSTTHDGLGPGAKNGGGYNVASCQAPLVPDNWMRASNGVPPELDGASADVDPSSLFRSSSMDVEISPPLLDWGTSGLYSASLAFLTVANVNRDNVLHVYEPFSTDPQFYVYGYEDLVLEPGENVSVAFVFLPRLLGSSSAHLVLQTNFGGFVIQAKGMAVESPYQIEPLVGLDIVVGGAVKRNLSIYNPFDDALSVEEVAVWMSSSESTEQPSHVVCQLGAFHEAVELASSSNDWDTADSTEFGRPGLDIRPREQWEVWPWKSNTVIEFNLWPLLEGKVFGAICMKLRSHTTDRMNTVVIPIELEVHGRMYYDSTSLVSVSFEHVASCDGSGSVFSLSLRNEASKLLRILSITEDNENSPMIFQVRYMKGLILFPDSVTDVALIRYTSPTVSEKISFDNCNIVIETNSSVGTFIKIPCQDLVRASVSYTTSSVVVQPDGSHAGPLSQEETENSANARTGSLGSILEDSHNMKPTVLRAVEADDMILRSWRSHGTRAGVSVLKDHELLFPVVQVGSQFSKWITVHNPSLEPAVMQMVLNSEETIDQCKAANDASDHTFSSRSPEIDSTGTRFGFSLTDSAITDAFVGPSESASFGPVVFRPSNRCMWSSLALIRNNLSGVEWLPLRAHGGLQSVVLLEGSEPVWKLEFNLESNVRNVSSLSQGACPSCSQQLSKEIHVKNTGDLPLQVKRVKVSGADCDVDGFTVDSCKGFGLAPSESIRLLISYRADFSSAMVQRDLELAMTTGIFVIPMTANIPVCMLNQCRKSYFRLIDWKASILVFGIVSLLVLVLVRIVRHSFIVGTEDYYIKIDNSSSSTISKTAKPSFLHRSNKTSRFVREHNRPGGGFTDKYPVGVLDGPKRTDDKKNADEQKKTTSSPSASTISPVEDSGSRETPESSGNLTIRVARDKGRRRKRKVGGAGLAAKFEVSSSHSGNSTPSSPLSPNASTPKQGWPLSPETASNPFSSSSEESKHQKKLDSGCDVEARAPPSENRYESNWLPSAKEQPPATSAPSGNLLPPVTALTPAGHIAGVPSVILLASSSPIVPHARAPGSNLMKDKAVKREENAVPKKEFTYDIWGDHFSDHLLGKAKEVSSSKVFDASEGDSKSFFAREPQSLMMKPSSALPVCRGRRSSPSDVTSAYEIN